MIENVITVQGVVKTFGGHTAVDHLDLEVPQGSVFGFIGPNGSGKSTTLRMIMNIILPDQGRIEVLGRSDTLAARDEVSYLPEERGLYKKMTVLRLLSYFGRLKGMKARELKIIIPAWLEKMDLAEWADRKVETLSKGMSQKVQFISALISNPRLLILDEPFSGLDPVNADLLTKVLLEQKEKGKTIIFSTHDMDTAENLCDRICMIYKGKKVLDGTLEDIQASHGQDAIRIRTEDGVSILDGLDEVESFTDGGNYQDVRIKGNSEAFLKNLVAKTKVLHFETRKPTLHEIFVEIAGPQAQEPGHK